MVVMWPTEPKSTPVLIVPGFARMASINSAAVRHAVLDASPAAVINCAAWTDVDGAESAEDAAAAVNGLAAGSLAAAATAVGAHLVHVSTDYVFAGDKAEAYVESDPVDPRTAYGRTKLHGEAAVREAADEVDKSGPIGPPPRRARQIGEHGGVTRQEVDAGQQAARRVLASPVQQRLKRRAGGLELSVRRRQQVGHLQRVPP